jgi:flagellar hook-associated protein 1 FlgK
MSINFSAFEIGRRALLANQFGISVTGQNISNVNTYGYTRQSAQFTESGSTGFGRFAVGSGVTISGVQSFRDQFIESRMQVETGIAGRLSARRDALSPVETALQGTETSGLQSAMNNFFGAFRDLEANPASLSLRAIVAQRGAALANAFHSTDSSLENIRTGVDGQIRTTVDQVNTLAGQVAGLNDQIRQAEAGGGNASSLRDQRGVLVSQISELTGARSVENDDGTVTLTIGEGQALVTGGSAKQIGVSDTPPLGLASLTIDGNPAVFDEGTIRGFQDAITAINSQIADLDGLAAQVTARVNSAHTSGTDLDGAAGVNFFNAGGTVTAANISVNTAVVGNPRLVVASPLTTSSGPGAAGTVAGQIANLLTDTNTTVGSRTGSFSSIFSSMVGNAGDQVKTAEDGLQTQSAIMSQLSAQRDAVSGVSLDEEAINMLQYQKAYEAAARFLKVADEMTQTILSLAQ